MDSELVLYALGIWVIFYVIAVIFGSVFQLMDFIDSPLIYWIYIMILLVVLIALTHLFIENANAVFLTLDLVAIGVLWVIMTIVVDFLLGVPWGGGAWIHAMDLPRPSFGNGGLIMLLAQLLAPITVYHIKEA